MKSNNGNSYNLVQNNSQLSSNRVVDQEYNDDDQVNSYNINTRTYQYRVTTGTTNSEGFNPNGVQNEQDDVFYDNSNINNMRLTADNQMYFVGDGQESDLNNQSYTLNITNQEQERSGFIDEDALRAKAAKDNEFYFQKKIRNSGFWGRVRLRRGTWCAFAGVIIVIISLVLITIFWGWWYGPALNIPFRVLSITLLCTGFFTFWFGVISNYFMNDDPVNKHILGSPVRLWSWVILGSIICLIIASALMAEYYLYWHNRFVNTPLIVISMVFFILAPIALLVALIKTYKQCAKDKYKAVHGTEMPKKKKKNQNAEDEETDQEEYQINRNDQLDYSINENDMQILRREEVRMVNDDLEERIEQDQIDYDENSVNETKQNKNFRKKIIRFAPRTPNANYQLQNTQ